MERAEIVAFWKQHKDVWEKSNATKMTNLSGMDVIEVIVPGRKSGEERSVLLTSLPADDGGWIVTASNLGSDKHPNWWLNLQANDLRGSVRAAGDDVVAAEVVELQGDERQRAWDRLVASDSSYGEYETATSRVIPVIELRPVGDR